MVGSCGICALLPLSVLVAPRAVFLLLLAGNRVMLSAGKNDLSALPVTVGGWPSRQGAASCPLIFGKGGCPMVTYSDLIQIGILIVGICSLFLQARKKK